MNPETDDVAARVEQFKGIRLDRSYDLWITIGVLLATIVLFYFK